MKKILIVLSAILWTAAAAAMTNSFTYQGRLSDENGPANDVFSMFFILHNHPTEGDGIGVQVLPEVPVTNGLFTVGVAFPDDRWDGGDRWLSIHLRRMWDTNSPFTELTPRQAVSPAPYALLAKTVPIGAIHSQHISQGAVGAAQLAAGAVTSSIAPGSITGDMLAGGTIQAGHLAPGTIASNLAAGAQSAVGSGGVVLSENAMNTNLLGLGYVKVGKVELVPESLQELAQPPVNVNSLQRIGYSVVWTGSEYIIWGGRAPDSSNNFYNDGARYNPASNAWTYIPPDGAPGARYGHKAVWTGSEMIVWGGAGSYPGNERGARFNPATGLWSLMSTNGAPPDRSGASLIWAGTHLICWGGYTVAENDVYTFYNAGYRYSPAADAWSPVAFTGAPSGRANHSALWTGTEMIIWGGMDRTYFPERDREGFRTLANGARYNPANNTWGSISTGGAPTARRSHSATWSGTEMIVWGGTYYDWVYHPGGGWQPPGYYQEELTRGSGARYNPATDAWTEMSTAGAPSARCLHSAVWTGSHLVVWGGKTSASFGAAPVATGGIYNPVNNSWIATSTANAPRARAGHTAAWSGSRMIVWDTLKLASGEWVEDGGRLDPSLNAWTGIATTGDLVARRNFASAWTGSELLIWGGEDLNGNLLRSGLRFNPANQQWSFMSLANAPEPRKNPLSAWTGSEFIVWGGETDSTLIRSGARYNPATDTWIPLPLTNAPSGRRGATAVWAGGHFIVWGGQGATHLTLTGAKFSPSTGLWTATSIPNPLQPRRGHAAVSTGDAMMVWGGSYLTNALGDGAMYLPGTDQWLVLPEAGAPSARTNHSAIWTGTELVVFGGENSAGTLFDGAGFNPATGTWNAIDSSHVAQAGRARHRAVWAYDRMVVLGSSSANFNIPSLVHSRETDVWTQGTIGIARIDSHVFWTGTEALWWTGDGGCRSYAPSRFMYLYLRP